MKKNLLFAMTGIGTALFTANAAKAQDAIVVEDMTLTEVNVDCKTQYSSSWRDNWFLQLGAGIQSPFVENELTNGGEKHHITTVYNAGFGHWFSPYLALRFSGYYGSMHWDDVTFSKAKTASLNMDLMWDMFNSISGPNANRVFSMVPFVGVGGTYNWDIKGAGQNIENRHGRIKANQWLVPVSAGIQFRFRLCKYVDFFAEGRATFAGDNFDNDAIDRPIDVNLQAIGGLTFNFGGKKFNSYNPCDYISYVNGLNNQVNNLRGELAATSAALAVAESQLPCPEVTVAEVVECPEAPMLAAVRFKIGSAVIEPMEMVNIYNVAEYLKANPEVNLSIEGYADKDTGTSAYNMKLSERRAAAVAKVLTDEYGISASRLTQKYYGSDQQPYNTNNWNRIVLFSIQ